MSTNAVISHIGPAHLENAVKRERGAFVKQLMDDDGRSARYMAAQIGISNSAVSDRLKGKAPFLADELEQISRVLRLNPVDFYRYYISIGTDEDPRSHYESEGLEPPARLELATCALQGSPSGELVDMFAWAAARKAAA